MMSDHYKPISCALHSEYELAIMHHQKLRIQWRITSEQTITQTLKPYDIITSEGSEYLLLHALNEPDIKIRLDKIIDAQPITE